MYTENVIQYFTTEHYSVPYLTKAGQGRNESNRKASYSDTELEAAHREYVKLLDALKEIGWDSTVKLGQPEQKQHSRIAEFQFSEYKQFLTELAQHALTYGFPDKRAQTENRAYHYYTNSNSRYAVETASKIAPFNFHLQSGRVSNMAFTIPAVGAAWSPAARAKADNPKPASDCTVDEFIEGIPTFNKTLSEQLEQQGYEPTAYNILALFLGLFAAKRDLANVGHTDLVPQEKTAPKEYMEFITNGIPISKALLYVSPLFPKKNMPTLETIQGTEGMPFEWFMKLHY